MNGDIKIGRLLCDEDIITKRQLNQALQAQVKGDKRTLGEILVDRGFCNLDDITEVILKHGNGHEEKQEEISSKTEIDFRPICSDATIFDFETIPAKKSIFVIGGVPEIGEVLAESVIEKIFEISHFSNSSFVLTGSHSHRNNSRDTSNFGWGILIKKFQLSVMASISLPTYWTMDQKFETPYVFTKKG